MHIYNLAENKRTRRSFSLLPWFHGMHSVLWLFVGDSFSGPCTKCNNGMPFSTYDRENDNAPNDMYYGHCAQWAKGGWWFNACHRSNLNGWYGDSSYAQGITWEAWKGFYDSLKSSTMKIRKLWKESSDFIYFFLRKVIKLFLLQQAL